MESIKSHSKNGLETAFIGKKEGVIISVFYLQKWESPHRLQRLWLILDKKSMINTGKNVKVDGIV